MVPWGEVIDNAPKVAAGAKKLWAKVGKTPLPEGDSSELPASDGTPVLTGAQAVLALQTQVTELQLATACLHQQMQESSALIQSLAEQNTQLVQRLDLHRKRLLWLSLLCAVLAGVGLYQVLR
jgi:hypothetical protein